MQDTAAILIATLAGGFLAYRSWRHFIARKSGTCGACSNCPSSSDKPNLVQLSPDFSHAEAQRTRS